MGWSSASRIMDDVIRAVQPVVPDEEVRLGIYRIIGESLQEGDWDTEDECVGQDPAYDRLYQEWYAGDLNLYDPDEDESSEDEEDES